MSGNGCDQLPGLWNLWPQEGREEEGLHGAACWIGFWSLGEPYLGDSGCDPEMKASWGDSLNSSLAAEVEGR